LLASHDGAENTQRADVVDPFQVRQFSSERPKHLIERLSSRDSCGDRPTHGAIVVESQSRARARHRIAATLSGNEFLVLLARLA
jgi:hypothetical protein